MNQTVYIVLPPPPPPPLTPVIVVPSVSSGRTGVALHLRGRRTGVDLLINIIDNNYPLVDVEIFVDE